MERVVSWRSVGSSIAAGGFAPLLALAAVVVAELASISLLYRHDFNFSCAPFAPYIFCAGLSLAVVRAVAASAAACIALLSRREAFLALLTRRVVRLDFRWLAVQFAGYLFILAPWSFMDADPAPGVFAIAVVLWLTGAFAASLGAVLAVVRLQDAWAVLSRAGPIVPAAAVFGALAPDLGLFLRPYWHTSPLTVPTFEATAWLLELLDQAVFTAPAVLQIGVGEFRAQIGQSCSGIEGLALIGAFTVGYLGMFRRQLAFPAALILLPVGLALSWALNVVRIAMLMLIGAYVSPELAVDGFHSHAGWMMFTALAVAMLAFGHRIRWLRRSEPGHEPLDRRSGRGSEADALIVPFIVMMAASLTLSTFTTAPALFYPLKVFAVGAALWTLRRAYGPYDLIGDGLAWASGAMVGLVWIALSPGRDPTLEAELALLPSALFLLWATFRLIGTVLIVPLVEELFFRAFLLKRFDAGTRLRVVGVVLSSGSFAALHGQWQAALIAGLVFCLTYLRRRRLGDAVAAHMSANMTVAAWAVATGDWSIL